MKQKVSKAAPKGFKTAVVPVGVVAVPVRPAVPATTARSKPAASLKRAKRNKRPAASKGATPKRVSSKGGTSKSRTKSSAQKPATPVPQQAIRLLDNLHSSWQDAMEAHRLRVEGQFRVARAAMKAPTRRKARDWEKVRSVLKMHVKSRKGRAKDLSRVEGAMDQILSRFGSD